MEKPNFDNKNYFYFYFSGIWPEGADGTDINTCCRSNNKKLVATGDDFGAVNLFKYPSVKLKVLDTNMYNFFMNLFRFLTHCM